MQAGAPEPAKCRLAALTEGTFMAPEEVRGIVIGVCIAAACWGLVLWIVTRNSDYPPGLQ